MESLETGLKNKCLIVSLQAWALGARFESSGRAVLALNQGSISPTPTFNC